MLELKLGGRRDERLCEVLEITALRRSKKGSRSYHTNESVRCCDRGHYGLGLRLPHYQDHPSILLSARAVRVHARPAGWVGSTS